MNEEYVKFKFLKDYRQFKAGVYIEIPKHRYTGQWEVKIWWDELTELINGGILEES